MKGRFRGPTSHFERYVTSQNLTTGPLKLRGRTSQNLTPPTSQKFFLEQMPQLLMKLFTELLTELLMKLLMKLLMELLMKLLMKLITELFTELLMKLFTELITELFTELITELFTEPFIKLITELIATFILSFSTHYYIVTFPSSFHPCSILPLLPFPLTEWFSFVL